MLIQIEFRGQLVAVRQARSEHDCVRYWDLMFPGSFHCGLSLSYAQLRQLGQGFHLI